MANKVNDFDDWATSQKTKNTKNQTIRRYPETIPYIERYLELRASGETDKSLTDLHLYLQEKFDYQLTDGALKQYIRVYQPELYKKAFGHNNLSKKK